MHIPGCLVKYTSPTANVYRVRVSLSRGGGFEIEMGLELIK